VGRIVRFPVDAGEIEAYLARAGSGFGPGVVVLDPGWSVEEVAHEICDRLAAVGFTALAPDLRSAPGELATTVRECINYLGFHPSTRGRVLAVVGVGSEELSDQAVPEGVRCVALGRDGRPGTQVEDLADLVRWLGEVESG
jgi:dienelactone hydrolase